MYTVQIVVMRSELKPIIQQLGNVLNCDNLPVCPLCETSPHAETCGFNYASHAFADLSMLDSYLQAIEQSGGAS